MEYTLKNIISLDKSAADYRESLDKKLTEEKKEFQTEITKMGKEFTDSLQKEEYEIMNRYLMEAEKAAADRKKNGDLELGLLREKYQSSKHEIVEKIFSALLKNV